ncbi:MAG: hypothetical protein AAGI38_17460 [Bacteroidota bacterium]
MNTPEQSAQIPSEDLLLESLKNDMAQVGATLKVLAGRVINEGVSDYPVFVASQTVVDIGMPIFDQDALPLNWFFYATILEDFVKKGIVKQENLSRFQRTFNDPEEKACIFLVTPEAGKFVFVPYEVEE